MPSYAVLAQDAQQAPSAVVEDQAVAEEGQQQTSAADTVIDDTKTEQLEEQVETEKVPAIEDMLVRSSLYELAFRLDQIPSLFFNSYEYQQIIEARKGLTAALPTEEEIVESIEIQEGVREPERGPRELALGGIVYKSSKDWTIWINGMKIQPDRLPPEILDIKVYKNHIKIKWFDEFTNQIFPIKLKTHQRFNIDTRIFLPG